MRGEASMQINYRALHICCRNGQSSALIGLLAALDTESSRDRIVNLGNYKSQTALHLAVKYGDSACVHYLLANGSYLANCQFYDISQVPVGIKSTTKEILSLIYLPTRSMKTSTRTSSFRPAIGRTYSIWE